MADTAIDDDGLDAASRAPAAAGWYAVTILCLALLASFTDRLVINHVVDPIRAELALTDFEISLLQGAGFAVIFALAGVPFGRLACAQAAEQTA